MAARNQARLGVGVFDGVPDRTGRRNAGLLTFGIGANAAAEDAWNQSMRTAPNLVPVSPDDVVAMRALARWRPKPPAAIHPKPTLSATRHPTTVPTTKSFLGEAGDQTLAGLRGAQDAFTFGLGDRAYAAIRALGDVYGGADLRTAYARRMAAEEARDRYDAQHYRTARTIGQIAGTAAQIAVLGPAEGAVASGSRIAQATPLIAREIGVLGGAGALSGAGGQAVADVARGKLGSIGDYAGAALGGTAGALVSRGGMASYGGAVDGGVTSMAQDIFNGRAPSIERAREAASSGGVVGTFGGIFGRAASNNITRKEKELLGEEFSRLRTWARGDKTKVIGKRRLYLDKRNYTYPDQRTYRGTTERDIVESKFGRRAELSKQQKRAYRQLPNYRVDHTLPQDVGVSIGLPMAQYDYASEREYR